MKNWMPKTEDVVRETIIVIIGAVLASIIVGNIPALRDWIKAQRDKP